jgi:hypothetical protein
LIRLDDRASRYRAVNLALVAGIVALLVAGVFALDVTASGDGVEIFGSYRLPELCLSKRFLGRACPSCNLGRSVTLLLHGDLPDSRAAHPGGLWLVVWTAAQGLGRTGLLLGGVSERFWPIDLGLSLGSLLVVCLVIVGS